MAYTITQARPLLNAAELELFDQSRAEPIKSLTLARLRGKATKARTLRDKYRDLFRRQTVSVRSAPTNKGRSPVGADNERTQRKADILQEVLGRFEARVQQLEAGEQREAAKTSRPAPAAKSKPHSQLKAAKAAKPTISTPSTPSTKPSTSTAGPAARGSVKVADEKPSQNAPGKAGAKNGSAAASGHATLAEAVLNQHATRSLKAPSDKAPTANGKAHAPLAHAPTDLVPAALRGNPIKQAPASIAMHAHQGANARRAQGKRDSR